MPLELEIPQLDTRTYEELKRLALLRVPRYAPQWTDFNESDPGVTLVELFAWLTEMMLYQMNRIPERSYLKFLQLLGLELRSAEPAVAHLTFTPDPGAEMSSILPRTPIGAQPSDGGDQLIFETTRGLDLIRLPLTKVQVFDGAAFTDVTLANENAGATFRPLGWVPQIGSALYLGFAPANTAVAQRIFPSEMRFRVFLPEAAQAGQPIACNDQTTLPTPPVTLIWEYRQKGNPPRWKRLSVNEDASIAFTREGYVSVGGPGTDAVTTLEGKVTEPLYWLRVRLAQGSYPAGRAPTVDFIRPNVVEAENLSTIRGEKLGNSSGLPGQVFKLLHRPVGADSLQLWIQEQNQEPELWLPRDDFLASTADDAHYLLNATAGEITLGDGLNGRIPTAGAQLVARQYRFGGGRAGNVEVGLINAPLISLPGVAQVINERPAVGGRDEQTVAELKRQAPAQLRHRNRAVSADDFGMLAAEVGGIARATAIPLAHPDHPGVQVPGAVTVIVVPDNDDMPPRPSQDQLDQVCRYLDARRLLTTELYVRGPEYKRITVTARIAAQPYAAFDDVRRRVNQAINTYLSPLGDRQTATTSGWQFGLDLFPTSLFDVILDVADVKAVKSLALTVNDQPWEKLTDPVLLLPNELVYGTREHELTIEPFKDA